MQTTNGAVARVAIVRAHGYWLALHVPFAFDIMVEALPDQQQQKPALNIRRIIDNLRSFLNLQ